MIKDPCGKGVYKTHPYCLTDEEWNELNKAQIQFDNFVDAMRPILFRLLEDDDIKHKIQSIVEEK